MGKNILITGNPGLLTLDNQQYRKMYCGTLLLCILSFFQAEIFDYLGVGKTTLIKKIVDYLKSQGVDCTGFYTEEVRNGGQRVGFDIVALNGNREILARKSVKSDILRPKVKQYEIYISEFEKLALPILEKPGPVLVIDEIGRMELFSKNFESSVKNIFQNKNLQIIATVPIISKLSLVEQLKKNVDNHLFTVEYATNTIFYEILKLFPNK